MSAPSPPQALPSDNTQGGAIARELAFLRGPGYQPADGTLIAADLMTEGDSLAALLTTQQNALNQAFPNSADQMLTDWEIRLGVPTDASASTSDRQAAITAKRRARGGNATRVLAAVQAIDPAALIFQTKCTDAAATKTPRQVFQWAIIVTAATWSDARKLGRIYDVVRQMAPAHTSVIVTTNSKFAFDDPNSLFDRDTFAT